MQKLGLLLLLLAVSGIIPAQQVMITEIMADPIPGKGLPEYEYVEVFTDHDVHLKGWVLKDAAGTQGIVDSAHLGAGKWTVLCSREASIYLNDFDPVVVEPWPVLNNGGDVLMLYDETGQLSDSLTYDNKWHDMPNNGGISLERIHAEYRCDPSRNWRSSRNKDGGTPGKQNSIYEEKGPPIMLDFYPGDPAFLWFNDRIDPFSVHSGTVLLSPPPDSIEFRVEGSKVALYHIGEPDMEYELELNGISTCSGTVLPDTRFSFHRARPPETNEISINELYFNPPPGQVDYLELINVTGDVLTLAGSYLSYETSKGRTDYVYLDTLQAMAPHEIRVITSDAGIVANAFPSADQERLLEMAEMINMPDDRAWVRFFNADSVMVDEVYFDHLFHHSSITNKEGVALERIDPARSAITNSNWMSAAFSGSPTLVNSQFKDAEQVQVWVEPRILDKGEDFTIHYTSVPAGSTAAIRLFSFNGMLLKTFGESILTGVKGKIELELPGLTSNAYLIQLELLLPDGRTRRYLRKIYLMH
jgi:hypothetical protein